MAWFLYAYGAIRGFARKRGSRTAFLTMLAALVVCPLWAAPSHAQGHDGPSHRATPARSGGGVLGFLFGAPDPDRYRRRGEQDYRYSPAPRTGGGYRTLCVRMCDGYYWPLSFSTGRDGLMRDAERCESSCDSEARLFYHYSAGAVEGMVDLEGRPYSGLEHAFRYRAEYVAGCKCRPEPWSEEAKAEYERRAEVEVASGTAEEEEMEAPGEPDAGSAEGASAAPDARAAMPPPARQAPRRRGLLESFNPFGRWRN